MLEDPSRPETQTVTSRGPSSDDSLIPGFLQGMHYCALEDLGIDAEHLLKKITKLMDQLTVEKLPSAHQPSYLDGKIADNWDWKITEILSTVEVRCPHRVKRVERWPKTADLAESFLRALTLAREQTQTILKENDAEKEIGTVASADASPQTTPETQAEKSERVKAALSSVSTVLADLAKQLEVMKNRANDLMNETGN